MNKEYEIFEGSTREEIKQKMAHLYAKEKSGGIQVIPLNFSVCMCPGGIKFFQAVLILKVSQTMINPLSDRNLMAR